MKLTYLDYMATSRASFLHQRSTWSKISTVILFFIGLFWSETIFSLSINLSIILLLLVLTRINLKYLLLVMIYPLVFTSLYMLVFGHELSGLVFIRVAAFVFNILLLISTTTISEIVTFFKPILPQMLQDLLFLTYRSFFILISRIGLTFQVLRLKGGYDPKKWLVNLRYVGSALGLGIINSLEMSERMYSIMAIRGHSGGMVGSLNRGEMKNDLVSISLSLISIIVAVIM